MHAGVYYIKNTALMTGRGLKSLKQQEKKVLLQRKMAN
jgi:hypothetical protein